jgi:hypothetical protein
MLARDDDRHGLTNVLVRNESAGLSDHSLHAGRLPPAAAGLLLLAVNLEGIAWELVVIYLFCCG